MDITGTFKYTKTRFRAPGIRSRSASDALYFNHPQQQAFVRLDKTLYDRIQAGEIRL